VISVSFFFSRRRRHTRFSRDWSSDVCSSDLLHERGTTVLFVSHDAAAVRALCSRAILLNHGQMIADGAPAEVLNRYQEIVMERERAYEAESESLSESESAQAESFEPLSFSYRHGNRSAEIVVAELADANN